MTGFLRPMVLLPAAWLVEMPPAMLEAVIAHELAHIRRFDLWVNLFQRLLETLLFYHPAVWWLSRRVRLAREMCCDELAAAATGERVVYASALELAARKRLVPARSLLEVALGVTRMTLLAARSQCAGLGGRKRAGPLVAGGRAGALGTAGDLVRLGDRRHVGPGEEAGQRGESRRERKTGRSAGPSKVHGNRDVPGGAASRRSWQGKPRRNGLATVLTFTRPHNNSFSSAVSCSLRPCASRPWSGFPPFATRKKSGDPLKWLKSQVHVTFPGNAEIMEVSLTADDPDEAVTLLRAIVDAYLHGVVNAEQDRKRARLAEVDKAVNEKEQEIRASRESLKKLAATLGMSATPGNLTLKQKLALEEVSLYRQELTRTQSEVRRVRAELAAAQAALKSVDDSGVSDAEINAILQNDPVGRLLSTELGWKKLDQLYMDTAIVKGADSLYVERHQKALKTLQKSYDARKAELIKTVRQKRRSLLRAEVRKLEISVAVLAEQEEALQTLVDKKSAEATRFGKSNVDLQMLQSDIKNAEAVWSQLASERDKLRVECRATARVTLLEPPARPVAPDD